MKEEDIKKVLVLTRERDNLTNVLKEIEKSREYNYGFYLKHQIETAVCSITSYKEIPYSLNEKFVNILKEELTRINKRIEEI